MMRSARTTRVRLCAAIALGLLVGCAKTPPRATAPAQPAPLVHAAELPPAATPAALPAVVSATAGSARPAAQRPTVSVDLHGGPEENPGPIAVGDAASFRVRLRDADGTSIRQLDPLLGGKMLLVVTRADLSWSIAQRADELSDKEHGAHEFRLIFPLSGIFRAWVIFGYAGTVYTEELSFSVTGKPSPGQELPETQALWRDETGLAGRLKVLPASPTTCEPFLLATAWTRHDVPVRMTAEPDAQTTWYVLVESGLAEIVPSSSQPQPVSVPGDATATAVMKMGGDLGTAVTLQVSRPGRYRVLAVATPPAAKTGHPAATVVAPFVLTVQGAAAVDGCKK